MTEKTNRSPTVHNRKASHEYELSERWEAGIVLQGTEAKSLRTGKVNLSDGWVKLLDGEAFLMQVHISPYSHGNIYNHNSTRPRKLLLSKKELIRITNAIQAQGMTVVPTKLYCKKQWFKLEIALARGKKHYDKRESSKEKDAQRDMDRALKR